MPHKTLNEVLTAAIADTRTHIQVLPEVMSGARLRKEPRCTEISFLTTNITPTDVMGNEAKFVGLIVWVPRDLYPS